jgi:hypothetical protein
MSGEEVKVAEGGGHGGDRIYHKDTERAEFGFKKGFSIPRFGS